MSERAERDRQAGVVAIVERGVEKRPRGRRVPTRHSRRERTSRLVPVAFGTCERRTPTRKESFALGVDDGPHTRTHHFVARDPRERRGKRFARARCVEHPRTHERTERRRIACEREGAPEHQGRSRVGRIGLHFTQAGERSTRIVLQQPRFGASQRTVRAFVLGCSLEPELGASAIACAQIEVGELEERCGAFVASWLCNRERAHERVPHLRALGERTLSCASEPKPHLGTRWRSNRELLEREVGLGVEAAGLAGVREERERER